MTLQVSAWSASVIATCCACGLLGCGKAPSRVGLQGTYVASYPQAQERLVLHPDGRFTQTVICGSLAKTNEATGTWRYDSKGRYIVFDENYMGVLDGFGQVRTNYDRPSRGISIFPVTGWFGRLSIDANEGVAYRKVKR